MGRSFYVKPAKFFVISLVLLMIPVVFAISCQKTAPAPPSPSPGTQPTSTNVEVTIAGFAFKPDTITIPAGTTVIWQNNDSVTHTVTARDGLFDSGNLATGNTFSYTFNQSGTFDYYCAIHPRMTAKVIVP